MSDLAFYSLAVLFIFVAWVYTGGPNKPFSFSGPFITPITDVGQTQVGYGDSNIPFNHYDNGSTWGNTKDTSIPASQRSARTGEVRISSGNLNSTDTRSEYLVLRSDSSSDVSITGWRLVAAKAGVNVTIPSGTLIAQKGGVLSRNLTSIVLKPNTEAYVSTGVSPVENSFQETKCTGYLNANNAFNPFLSSRCPAPIDDLKEEYGGNATLYDKCSSYVNSIGSCRVPNADGTDIPNSCRNFVEGRLNYDGCLSAHRSDDDFTGDRWRIFLDERHELWRNSGDTITLLDANGKIVDQYSY